MRARHLQLWAAVALSLSALAVGACNDSAAAEPVDAGSDGGADAGDPYDLPGPPFAEQVDEYWGAAPDEATRLEIFDALWQNLAEAYACFSVLDVDWDEVRERYRPLVAEAEGYGRV
jgi:hypothetical protein